MVFFLVPYLWEFLVWLVGEGVGGSDRDLDLVGDFLMILVVLVDFESFEYILVLPCRGLVKHHSAEEKKKITNTWFIRVMIQILMLLHTIACHVRVCRF